MTEPILSSELSTIFSHLPPNYQRLFVKLFRFMYNYLLPVSRFISHGGTLYNFFLVNELREKRNLSVSELNLLTCLYNYSSCGQVTIRSDKLKAFFPGFASRTFVSLRKKGYITRHTWDPYTPHYSSHRSRRPIFISLTSSAIRTIKDIERDLRTALYNTTLIDVTSTPLKSISRKNKNPVTP